MKFSLIGTGFIFPAHVEAIRDVGGEIVDVVNDARSSDAWREMVETTTADCVVVLTPNDLHFEMVQSAATHGKIVICEKPLVLTSEHAHKLAGTRDMYTVLQLHYHPLVQQLKEGMRKSEKYDIEMDISVYRDEAYYAGWKGQKERSGGVLFNLGIHYFDLLLYLFGPANNVTTARLDEKTGEGTIKGDTYVCRWRISIDAQRDQQKRTFRINGTDYNFSSKDNLSYENLHRYVYEDVLQEKGVLPEEAQQSIELVEQLYKSYGT